jgi:hypothetical protein
LDPIHHTIYQLQDAVPHTIHQLAKAGVKIWMLTGIVQHTVCTILTIDPIWMLTGIVQHTVYTILTVDPIWMLTGDKEDTAENIGTVQYTLHTLCSYTMLMHYEHRIRHHPARRGDVATGILILHTHTAYCILILHTHTAYSYCILILILQRVTAQLTVAYHPRGEGTDDPPVEDRERTMENVKAMLERCSYRTHTVLIHCTYTARS